MRTSAKARAAMKQDGFIYCRKEKKWRFGINKVRPLLDAFSVNWQLPADLTVREANMLRRRAIAIDKKYGPNAHGHLDYLERALKEMVERENFPKKDKK